MKIRLSKGGQFSLPAEIRRRWATDSLVVEDLGDRVVLRPIPSDPVAAVMGAFPTGKGSATQARNRIRKEELRGAPQVRRMILLDATALIAAFLGEPSGEQVEALLRGGDAGIPAANLTEVFDVLVRVFGNDLEAVEARLVPLLVTSLPVIAIGGAEARRTAQIRISHYHRQDAPLSLADCLLLGTGLVLGAAVATSDAPLARAGRAEGLEVVALRDTFEHSP